MTRLYAPIILVVVIALALAANRAAGQNAAGKLEIFVGADAKLVEPFAIEFDTQGNGYIVELSGCRLLKVDTKGKVTTLAGALKEKGDTGDRGPAEKARLNGPHNLVVAPGGDIYIADTFNRKVRRLDARSDTIFTFAGTGKKGYSGDDGPADKAAFGDIYCASLAAHTHMLYLADLDNRRVRAIDLTTDTVRLFAGNGERGIPGDGAEAKAAPLVDPRAVAADSKGNVYILERSGNALRVVDAAGKIRTVVGASGKAGLEGDGGDAKSAKLNGPKHLCIDAEGNVLIADTENHAVRKYVPATGKIYRVAGSGKKGASGVGGSADKAELARPHGVSIGPGGKIYIADSENHRIVKIAE